MTTPLLALHGMLGTPAMFEAPLAPEYEPWLPGHGPDPDLSLHTFDAVADQMERSLTERFGATAVNVLGYSMGARFALAFCARHPQRFRNAVLISGHPGLPAGDTQARAQRRHEDEANAILIEREGLPALVQSWEQRPLFASQADVPLSRRVAQRDARSAHRPEGIAYALRTFGLAEMPSYEEAILDHATRMAFVVGALDTKFVGIAQRLQHTHPHLTVEIFPGVGHNVLFEAPALAARIASLLHSASRHEPAAIACKEQSQ